MYQDWRLRFVDYIRFVDGGARSKSPISRRRLLHTLLLLAEHVTIDAENGRSEVKPFKYIQSMMRCTSRKTNWVKVWFGVCLGRIKYLSLSNICLTRGAGLGDIVKATKDW
jgi:hypothetical protein